MPQATRTDVSLPPVQQLLVFQSAAHRNTLGDNQPSGSWFVSPPPFFGVTTGEPSGLKLDQKLSTKTARAVPTICALFRGLFLVLSVLVILPHGLLIFHSSTHTAWRLLGLL